MEIKWEIKTYLFCSVLESAGGQREMEVAPRCENDVTENSAVLPALFEINSAN